jgi:hypothetical protein
MNPVNSNAHLVWSAALKVIALRCEHCHRSMVLRHLFGRKAGFRLHEQWYCSPACFTSAAEEDFVRLLKSGQKRSVHIARMPLGLILMSRGLLTHAQLRTVMEDQRNGGGEIDELLTRLGWISESQLTAARAAQWSCPVFAVPKLAIRIGIHIPSTLVHTYSVIPVYYSAASNLLLMGFVRGIEYGLLFAIERITGCKTQPCFVTPSDFELQVHQRDRMLEESKGTTPEEVRFGIVQSPAIMARALCSYCVDVDANEVMIVTFKDYLWTRAKGGRREVDLLFKAC